jgi:hypothetical protein
VSFILFATVVKGFTIDGKYEAAYGSVISTQVLGTTANSGVANNLGSIDGANSSELDAAYGVITNDTLYLFFAGNIDTASGGSGVAYDKLHVFIMTDSGAGGDHTLGTNYSYTADYGHINRMGVGGGIFLNNVWTPSDPGSSGLTFDSSFYANYDLEVTAGSDTNVTMYANLWQICSNCPSYYLGPVAPTNTPPGNTMTDSLSGIQVALNNSNTNGVWGDINGCTVIGGCPSNCPPTVTNGVEIAIPLTAIGNPASSVSICAFITDDACDALYNQVLPPVSDGTTNYCNYNINSNPDESGATSTIDSSVVDFSNGTRLPGTHHFTLSVPSCNSFTIGFFGGTYPYNAAFPSSGGTSNVDVTACSWTASTSTNWVTITSGASGSGSGTIVYSVSTNTSISPRTATLYVVEPIPSSTATATQTVTISQEGRTLPPLGAFIVDGTADPGYGCPLAIQTMGTGYGKSTTTNLGTSGGSELDAAYGLVQNNTLFLLFTGKLESNGNHLHMFFMTRPGGTNTILNVEPLIDGTNPAPGSAITILRDLAATTNAGSGPGLTFDPGFAPNYWMNVNIGNPYHIYLDYAELWPGHTNAAGVATNGYYVGSSTTLTNGTLIPGSDAFGAGNPFGIQCTVNNSSHTNGVDGNSCVTNANPSAPCYTNFNSGCAVLVTNGIELAIPLAALGSPTGQIAVCAFIGGGQGFYMSNQILPPINPADGGCSNNLAGGGDAITSVNFGTLPGSPHYFYVGPEMRVTGVGYAIAGGATNVNVTYLPENNTNLSYQLQRTFAPLTTNSVWSSVGVLNFGGAAPITATDTHATNKVGTVGGILYRVRQSPNGSPGASCF